MATLPVCDTPVGVQGVGRVDGVEEVVDCDVRASKRLGAVLCAAPAHITYAPVLMRTPEPSATSPPMPAPMKRLVTPLSDTPVMTSSWWRRRERKGGGSQNHKD